MIESPQGSAFVVTHSFKTTNASVSVDGSSTGVYKVSSNEEDTKETHTEKKGKGLVNVGIRGAVVQKVVKTGQKDRIWLASLDGSM